MNKKILFALLLLLGLAVHGCSRDSGSNVLDGVTLENSKQGQSVGFVDVDGDGVSDKIVGAPYAASSSEVGAVLVYQGSATGYSSTPSMLLTGDDNTGFSFANLGDVDGDGMDDFAVGAINGDGEDVSLCGSVTVYKGGSNGQVIKKLAGEGPMDKFGFSIASGDLNYDGNNDIIVGAPFNTNDPCLYQSGAVYVYFGPDFINPVTLYASSTNKGLGWTAASGNVNNDAIPDLLISASGKVLVFFGGESFDPAIDSPDISIKSSASGFGKAIAVIGDLDGDGYGEIAIGAPNATINNNRDTGSVYIVKGSGTGTIDLGAATAELIVRIDGANLFDRFGSTLVPLGDMDADSIPDFAVGAPLADVNENDLSGKVYLFMGKDINADTTLSNAMAFNGMTANQGYGTSITPDGNGHLLIGAPLSDMSTGGVSMVDAATGEVVPGGSSGGSTGGGGECH